MGTHASITVKHTDGKYHGIYLHFDGYPNWILRILRSHYNSQELAEELISYGNASAIYETIEECDFYARDSGEESRVTIGDTWEEVLADIGEGYNYIFSNSKWDVLED